VLTAAAKGWVSFSRHIFPLWVSMNKSDINSFKITVYKHSILGFLQSAICIFSLQQYQLVTIYWSELAKDVLHL
jgi:hypothetical protein